MFDFCSLVSISGGQQAEIGPIDQGCRRGWGVQLAGFQVREGTPAVTHLVLRQENNIGLLWLGWDGWKSLWGGGGGGGGGKEGLIGHVSTIPLSKLEQHWGLFPNSDSWFE